MAIAYTNRCPASSWRGTPGHPWSVKNQCVKHEQSRTPHSVHRDEHGNNFIIVNGSPRIVDAHGKVLS